MTTQPNPKTTQPLGALQARVSLTIPSTLLDKVKEHKVNLSRFLTESLVKNFPQWNLSSPKPQTTQPQTVKVFVYGTLKQGFSNHKLMKHCQAVFQCEDSLSGAVMYDYEYFPFIHLGQDKFNKVYGELYNIPASNVYLLDQLEGYIEDKPEISMYLRKEVITNSGNLCYVYEGLSFSDSYPQINSGKWLQK